MQDGIDENIDPGLVSVTMPVNENIDPTLTTQPMTNRQYVPVNSALTTMTGNRDRGIINLLHARHKRFLQRKIITLSRFMDGIPFPGPSDIDTRSYNGPDYHLGDLENYVAICHRAGQLTVYCDPMTHNEYLRMCTACLTMMRIMLNEIPGVFEQSFPALWYTFQNMGELLIALRDWPRPLIGQIAAVDDFFNNPSWLPIYPSFFFFFFLISGPLD